MQIDLNFLLGLTKEKNSFRYRKPYRLEAYSKNSINRLQSRILSENKLAPIDYNHRLEKVLKIAERDKTIVFIGRFQVDLATAMDLYRIKKLFGIDLFVDRNNVCITGENTIWNIRLALLIFTDFCDLGLSIETIEADSRTIQLVRERNLKRFPHLFEDIKLFGINKADYYSYLRVAGYFWDDNYIYPALFRPEVELESQLLSDIVDVSLAASPKKIKTEIYSDSRSQFCAVADNLQLHGFIQKSPVVCSSMDIGAMSEVISGQEKLCKAIEYPHSFFCERIDLMGELTGDIFVWHTSQENDPNYLISVVNNIACKALSIDRLEFRDTQGLIEYKNESLSFKLWVIDGKLVRTSSPKVHIITTCIITTR